MKDRGLWPSLLPEGRLLRRCLGNTPPLRPGLQACCPRNRALNSDFRQREGAQARLVLRNLNGTVIAMAMRICERDQCRETGELRPT